MLERRRVNNMVRVLFLGLSLVTGGIKSADALVTLEQETCISEPLTDVDRTVRLDDIEETIPLDFFNKEVGSVYNFTKDALKDYSVVIESEDSKGRKLVLKFGESKVHRWILTDKTCPFVS